MIPHEKTLVKRLEDQPFALLGINSDDEATYRAKRVAMGVTWPSFFDGGATGGPIATKWGVTGWPTIYVLDHEGRIRYRGVRGEAMDRAVDVLLAEMRGEAPVPAARDGAGTAPAGSTGESIPAMRLIPMAKTKAKEGTPKESEDGAKKAKTVIPAARLIPMAKKKPAEKKPDQDKAKADDSGR